MNTRTCTRLFVCALACLAGLTAAGLLLNGALRVSASADILQSPEIPASINSAPISGSVTLWHAYTPGGGEEDALNQVISSALNSNPGLVITTTFVPFADIFTQYISQVTTGGGPDVLVFTNDDLGYLARAGLIRNLDTELLGRLTHFNQTAIDGMQVGGQLYGVPESAKAVGLYYNKSLLSAPPTTTAKLLSLVGSGKRLASVGPGGGAYFFYGFWSAFGGELMDASGRCIADRGGFIPAMQYLLDLQDAGAYFTLDDYNEAQSYFLGYTATLLINGPWALADYQAVMTEDLGIAPLPTGPAGMARPLNGIDGFYINPHTDNFTATLELALFMTSQASAQIFADIGGHIPVRSDVTSTNPLINTFAQISAQGFPRPQNEQFSSYWGPFGNMVTQVLSDTVQPYIAVQVACDAMHQLNGFSTFRLFMPFLVR